MARQAGSNINAVAFHVIYQFIHMCHVSHLSCLSGNVTQSESHHHFQGQHPKVGLGFPFTVVIAIMSFTAGHSQEERFGSDDEWLVMDDREDDFGEFIVIL